jgi:hypothetical protein
VADLSGPDGKPDSKIDATNDRKIVGTSQPKWEGGTTQRFAFRGFDLTVVAFARWGYTMNSSLYGGGFVNTYQGTYNNVKTHYWTPDNHEPWNPKPDANASNPLNRSGNELFRRFVCKDQKYQPGVQFVTRFNTTVKGKELSRICHRCRSFHSFFTLPQGRWYRS